MCDSKNQQRQTSSSTCCASRLPALRSNSSMRMCDPAWHVAAPIFPCPSDRDSVIASPGELREFESSQVVRSRRGRCGARTTSWLSRFNRSTSNLARSESKLNAVRLMWHLMKTLRDGPSVELRRAIAVCKQQLFSSSKL